MCVWEERRESQAKRREEKSGKRQGTKNFSLQLWGGRKILKFQGLEKGREGGRERGELRR